MGKDAFAGLRSSASLDCAVRASPNVDVNRAMVCEDDRNDSRQGSNGIESPHEYGGVRIEDGDGLNAAE